MNEWIYRNSLNEYDERLNAADNERRALRLTAKPNLVNVITSAVTNLRAQVKSQPAVKLQRNS